MLKNIKWCKIWVEIIIKEYVMIKDFNKKANKNSTNNDTVYNNPVDNKNEIIDIEIDNNLIDESLDPASQKGDDNLTSNAIIIKEDYTPTIRVKNIVDMDTERKINKFDLFFIKLWAYIVTTITSISEGINFLIFKIFKKRAPLRYINAFISCVIIILIALLLTLPFRVNVEKDKAISIFAKNLIPVQVVVGYDNNQPIYRWGYAAKNKVDDQPIVKALVIDATYIEALPFHSNGVAWVKQQDANSQYYWEIINTKGKAVSKNGLRFEVTNDMVNGYRPVGTFDESGLCWVIKAGKYGYINKRAKLVINCSYDYADNFIDNIARVARGTGVNRQEWFINTKEKTIGRSYDAVKPFSNGMGAIYRNGVWGFINKKGDEIITPKYNAVSQFVGDYAMVKMSKTFGVIDKKGNSLVADIEYSDVYIDNEIFRKFVEDNK